jgi:transposase-like protein
LAERAIEYIDRAIDFVVADVSRFHFPMYLKKIEFRFNHRGDNTFRLFLKAYFGYVSP